MVVRGQSRCLVLLGLSVARGRESTRNGCFLGSLALGCSVEVKIGSFYSSLRKHRNRLVVLLVAGTLLLLVGRWILVLVD